MIRFLTRFFRGSTPPILFRPEDRVRFIYAVGDVHGDLDAFLRIEALIAEDLRLSGINPEDALTLVLGDMIDRGPFSAHLLDHLTRTREVPHRVCLRGNHEQMLIDLLDGRGDPDGWLRLGGEATLRSYAPDLGSGRSARWRVDRMAELMPERHMDFLRALPHLALHGGVFYSHAGGDPALSLEGQGPEALLRRRPAPGDGERVPKHGLLSVHGHQPVPVPDIGRWRVNLDTSGGTPPRLSCAKICFANNYIEKILQA
jgi:serine/threonine protein phosphatase 1